MYCVKHKQMSACFSSLLKINWIFRIKNKMINTEVSLFINKEEAIFWA